MEVRAIEVMKMGMVMEMEIPHRRRTERQTEGTKNRSLEVCSHVKP